MNSDSDKLLKKSMKSFRKFLVTEFPDGIHVIPKAWRFLEGESLMCFFPVGITNERDFNTCVREISEVESHWEKLPIIKVYGCSDTFIRAHQKLGEVITLNLTEAINTENEEYQKSQRKSRAKKKRESSDDESQLVFGKKKKTHTFEHSVKTSLKLPTPPRLLHKSKEPAVFTINSKKAGHTQYTPQKTLPNASFELSRSPSLFSPSPPAHSTYINNTSTTQLPLNIISENHQSLHTTKKNISKLLSDSPSTSNPNKISHSPSSSKINALKNRKIQSTAPTQEIEYLKDLIKGQSIIINKLEEIIQTLLVQNEKSVGKCQKQQEFLDYFKNKFPLKTTAELSENDEKIVSDVSYASFLASRIKQFGRSQLPQFITRIMENIITNNLGTKMNFTGKKKCQGDLPKIGFSKLHLYRLICGIKRKQSILYVCRENYPSCTDDNIMKCVHSWIRHSKEREQREENM